MDILIPDRTSGHAIALATGVAAQYGNLPQVMAVALAGSQTTQNADAISDIDLYVYSHGDIPLAARREIAEQSSVVVEFNNQFWESGDEWIDAATKIKVDVMFRQTHWIEGQIKRLLEQHEASVGYSTCFWHNVQSSVPLFDRDGWFANFQLYANQPYPSQLQQHIIAKNHPILRDSLSSYLNQIKNAIRRNDRVSVNHRIAALLASYFDIVFALNELPHPGEKRLVQFVTESCEHVPDGMARDVERVLSAENDLIPAIHRLIDGLEGLLLLRDFGR